MGDLLNRQLRDGSRVFGELEIRASLVRVRDHALGLPGAVITGFLGGDLAEGSIDFDWEGYSFTIDDRHYAYFFAVADGTCPEALLHTVLAHFGQLVPMQVTGG